MSRTTVDLVAARRTLRALTPRTVALVASMADPGVPMSRSEWTVGEAAAHLVFGAKDYSEHARGVERCYRLTQPTGPGATVVTWRQWRNGTATS